MKSSLKLVFLTAICLGIILRLANLDSREFWYDEVLSLLLSNGQKIAYHTPTNVPINLADYTQLLSVPSAVNFREILQNVVNLLRGLTGSEPHPPLFFLSHYFWLHLFGNSEIGTRSLVTLLSIGAIASAYGLGKVILGHRSGLFFAALLAVNPFYLFHSLNFRMYGAAVFWVILSALSLLKLIKFNQQKLPKKSSNKTRIFWLLLLIISITAGCLTFYLFIYWLITLSVIIIYLDRQRWWQYYLILATGVTISLPWLLWGGRQQFRNADLERMAAPTDFFSAILKHLQDVFQVLGTHLFFGDWVTSIPPIFPLIAGIIIAIILVIGSVKVWQKLGFDRALILALIMAFFPLLLGFTADLITGKITLGFGWGRSIILILPGCLLLITVIIRKLKMAANPLIASTLLCLYLTISVGDFTLRNRQVFHHISEIINTEFTTPTLIIIDSIAWGNILRLAYYMPPKAPIQLLAQKAADLGPALVKAMDQKNANFERIIWLKSANPVWSKPANSKQEKEITDILQNQGKLTIEKQLSGTMLIDQFQVKVYQK